MRHSGFLTFILKKDDVNSDVIFTVYYNVGPAELSEVIVEQRYFS